MYEAKGKIICDNVIQWFVYDKKKEAICDMFGKFDTKDECEKAIVEFDSYCEKIFENGYNCGRADEGGIGYDYGFDDGYKKGYDNGYFDAREEFY